jgi:hypothetical protein
MANHRDQGNRDEPEGDPQRRSGSHGNPSEGRPRPTGVLATLHPYGAPYGVQPMRTVPGSATLDDMNALESLRRRLKLAEARRDGAASFSPDWDAAMAEIDELREAARNQRLEQYRFGRLDNQAPATL